MTTIDKGIRLIMKEFRKEYGEDAKIEEGETIVGVFNDCTIKISLENGNFEVEVVAGAPYKIDYGLNLLEK